MLTGVGIVVTLLLFFVGGAILLTLERHFSRGERGLLWLAYFVHAFAAVAVVWVTSEVLGGGDLLDYHNNGLRLTRALRNDFWTLFPDVVRVIFHDSTPLPVPIHGEGSATGSMMCLSALVFLVFGDSIYSACMAVSVTAFFARLAVYVAFRRALTPEDPRLLLAGCLLVPSVTFWCSGLLKEPMAIIGLSFFFWAVQAIASKRGTTWTFIAGAAGLALVGVIKPYILLPFCLGLGAWLYLSQRQFRAPLRSSSAFIGAVAFGVVSIVVGGMLFPKYAIAGLAEETLVMQMSGQRTFGGSNITLFDPTAVQEQATGYGALPYVPLALFTALFRPLIFEAKNAQMLVNGLETLAFTVVFVIAFARNGFTGTWRIITKHPVLGLCAVYVLVGSIGIGMATANLGSLSRYRSPLTPYFAAILAVLYQQRATRRAVVDQSSVFRVQSTRF